MSRDENPGDHHNTFTAERRDIFNRHAAAYRDGRPGYPPEVFIHLERTCGLGPEQRVLEVGPGSGQATAELLASGAQVTAVEASPELAKMLLSRCLDPQLDVVVGLFESVTLTASSFDLLAAGTSFHWIDPGPGLAKAAEVLRPGGWLALWWTCFGDPDRQDPYHLALRPILQRLAPHLVDDGNAGVAIQPYALDHAARSAEVEASGFFSPVDQLLVPWTASLDAVGTRQLLASFSPFMALPDDIRTAVLDEAEQLVDDQFGGIVERPCVTAVYTAQYQGSD